MVEGSSPYVEAIRKVRVAHTRYHRHFFIFIDLTMASSPPNDSRERLATAAAELVKAAQMDVIVPLGSYFLRILPR